MASDQARTLGTIALGVMAAAVIAGLLAVPQIFGIDTWKWALGAVGLAVFVAAGRRAST